VIGRLGRRAALGAAAGSAALLALAGDAEADAPRPLALERALPALRGRIPRAGLWSEPAPVHPARALGEALGLARGLWLVRDDLGGTVFGGGKARKLDLLIGEATARGATAVVTTGGTGSNHARSVAWAAAAAGLGCRLALLPEPTSPEVKRNLAAIEDAGARVAIGGRDAVERAEAAARRSGGTSAWIPMGGTSPLGNLAFVSAALEIAERARAGELPAPATAVVALGSVGSAVGLALGFALAGSPTRVVAVRCSSPATSSRAVIDAAIADTSALLRRMDPRAPDLQADARGRLIVEPGELGHGYARATAASTRAAALLHDHEGVTADGTYTAKAAAHVVRHAARLREGPVALWLGCDARWLAGRGTP
jgi:D-cysteine desulfhydrase